MPDRPRPGIHGHRSSRRPVDVPRPPRAAARGRRAGAAEYRLRRAVRAGGDAAGRRPLRQRARQLRRRRLRAVLLRRPAGGAGRAGGGLRPDALSLGACRGHGRGDAARAVDLSAHHIARAARARPPAADRGAVDLARAQRSRRGRRGRDRRRLASRAARTALSRHRPGTGLRPERRLQRAAARRRRALLERGAARRRRGARRALLQAADHGGHAVRGARAARLARRRRRALRRVRAGRPLAARRRPRAVAGAARRLCRPLGLPAVGAAW